MLDSVLKRLTDIQIETPAKPKQEPIPVIQEQDLVDTMEERLMHTATPEPTEPSMHPIQTPPIARRSFVDRSVGPTSPVSLTLDKTTSPVAQKSQSVGEGASAELEDLRAEVARLEKLAGLLKMSKEKLQVVVKLQTTKIETLKEELAGFVHGSAPRPAGTDADTQTAVSPSMASVGVQTVAKKKTVKPAKASAPRRREGYASYATRGKELPSKPDENERPQQAVAPTQRAPPPIQVQPGPSVGHGLGYERAKGQSGVPRPTPSLISHKLADRARAPAANDTRARPARPRVDLGDDKARSSSVGVRGRFPVVPRSPDEGTIVGPVELEQGGRGKGVPHRRMRLEDLGR
ncbi:hypothetical protein J8273_4667 [Carpediemonas membranifera]|uniref:Uncharacterized protein n=1 Tax=Carpediemonas membranifera TaxID=201153 RepID=A0A8J6DZL8_9EUKA|nr:hypothetical protein J8273_4667 [Carpediemonas membranifera]|eukprot:KAG9393804.1 hypothetical protein J8273_4667 [Carpediemonas membranifera]